MGNLWTRFFRTNPSDEMVKVTLPNGEVTAIFGRETVFFPYHRHLMIINIVEDGSIYLMTDKLSPIYYITQTCQGCKATRRDSRLIGWICRLCVQEALNVKGAVPLLIDDRDLKTVDKFIAITLEDK